LSLKGSSELHAKQEILRRLTLPAEFGLGALSFKVQLNTKHIILSVLLILIVAYST